MSTNPAATTPGFTPIQRPFAAKCQRGFSAIYLAVLVLMCTQYAVCKYGPAWVLITPIGIHDGDRFAYEVKDQQPGLYVINWATLDDNFWKLDDGTFLPPAEGVLALLFLVALTLWPLVGRRYPIWPRFAAWSLVGLGAVSLLAAAHFKPGVRELAQVVLTVIVAWWVAGMAIADDAQFKRFTGWLGALTVLLVLYGLFDYWRFVLRPDVPMPTSVRATCASRTAYSGLMVMLLALAGARVIAAGRPVGMVGWSAICVIGLVPILNAGALLAVAAAWTAILSSRGFFGFLIGLALSIGLIYGVTTVSPSHKALLAESVQFYRSEHGGPVGVEKRYLEMAAALSGLREAQPVTGETPDENGSLPVIGERSNVILGVGPGLNYQKTIGAFYGNLDNPEKQEPDTYNLYLLLAVQMGLAAALCWAWLLFDGAATARLGMNELTDPDQRAFLLGVYGACLGLVVFSVYGTILVRGTALVLFTLLGVASRLLWQLQPQPAPKPKKERAPKAVAVVEPPAVVPSTEPAPELSESLPTEVLSTPESETSLEITEPSPVMEESTPQTSPLDLDAPPAAAKPAPADEAGGELDWAAPESAPASTPDTAPDSAPAAQPASAEDQAAAEEELQAWLKQEGLLDNDEDGAAKE